MVPLSPRVARPGESDPWPGLGLEAKVIETNMSSIRNDRKYIKKMLVKGARSIVVVASSGAQKTTTSIRLIPGQVGEF